uniref:Uncharacterized protein n=1 Tax=Laticauda laticaudata TaxID=8630 RepID=A0A8C5RQB8_LATLA
MQAEYRTSIPMARTAVEQLGQDPEHGPERQTFPRHKDLTFRHAGRTLQPSEQLGNPMTRRWCGGRIACILPRTCRIAPTAGTLVVMLIRGCNRPSPPSPCLLELTTGRSPLGW